MRRSFSVLVLIFLTCGLAACSIHPDAPLDLSFTAPHPARLSGQGYDLPNLADGELAGAEVDAYAVHATGAGALSLLGAWQLALEHSHAYQAAIKGRKAAATLRVQGRARLLPHIQAGYSFFHISGERWQPTPFGQTLRRPLDYNSKALYVQLQQPVLNFDRYSDYYWYVARARQGKATWQVARYELAGKLTQRWIDILAARAKLELHEERVNSLTQQFEAQKTLYEYGAGRVIDVRQTRSRLQTARARLIGGHADLRVIRRSLQALIGGRPGQLKTLVIDSGVPSLALKPLSYWQRRARKNNARIEAHQAAETVATATVDRHVKSQWPKLNFIASWKHAESGDLATLGQRSNTYAVGLQLTVPIFSGGRDNAEVTQSRAQRRQASYELKATVQKTQTEVARHYQNVHNAMERIQALQVSVNAGELALKATRIGYKYGGKDNLDVLRARDELFQTRQELLQARLDLLRSYIQLRLTAGGDPAAIFRKVGALFLATQRPST